MLDCSGRSGVLARANGLRVYDEGPRTIALVASWRSERDWNLPDASHTVVESFQEGGWAWSVPDLDRTPAHRGDGQSRAFGSRPRRVVVESTWPRWRKRASSTRSYTAQPAMQGRGDGTRRRITRGATAVIAGSWWAMRARSSIRCRRRASRRRSRRAGSPQLSPTPGSRGRRCGRTPSASSRTARRKSIDAFRR